MSTVDDELENEIDERWQTLPKCPGTGWINVHLQSQSTFIVLTYGWRAGMNIFEYNTNNKEWKLRCKMNEEVFKSLCCDFTSSFDIKTQSLYILDRNANFVETKLSENSDIKLQSKLHSNSNKFLWSVSAVIDGEFHVFGGAENNEHLKYNQTIQNFETLHTFTEFDGLCAVSEDVVSMAVLQTNQHIILFGAWQRHHNWPIYKICIYNIKQNEWRLKDLTMPQHIEDMGELACTLAIRNKYILVFGGKYDNGMNVGYTDDIYIYSLEENRFIESKIRCPISSVFEAITISDSIKDEKLTLGFVRKQWKIANIEDHFFPPSYLLKLIQSYVLIEFVHLFDRDGKGHWKINTLDIVPCDK